MAQLLFNQLSTKSLDKYTNDVIEIINKRKSSGFDGVTLDENFMKGRCPFATDCLSIALKDLGYKNNLDETQPNSFTISW